MEKDRSNGFSLLELMVTVIVIGILAMIAIPIFQGYRDRAHRSVDETNLRMLAHAVKLFAYDNNHLPASLDDLCTAVPPGSLNTSFNQYIAGSLQTLTCPSDLSGPTGFRNGVPIGGRSYAINVNAVAAAGSKAVSWLQSPANADTILIFESDAASGNPDVPPAQEVLDRHHKGWWGRITVNEQIL